jgi:hypothetical protein
MQNALYLFINVKGVLIRKKLGNSLQPFNKDFSALFQPLRACLLGEYHSQHLMHIYLDKS